MDAKPKVVRGWPGGMNNVLPDYDLPVNDDNVQTQLRNVVNADVLTSGRVKRRSGTTKRVNGNVHSFYALGDIALAVVDNVLSRIAPNFEVTPIVTLDTTERVAFTGIGGVVYYSNGLDTGRIIGDQNYHWGVETPETPPTLSLIGGGLPVGRYSAVCTFIDQFGEESGCGRSSNITLAAPGGIRMSIPQPLEPYIRGVRVYMSSHNDGMLHEVAQLPVGQTIFDVTMPPLLGMALETQHLRPFLPTTILEADNGRIYGANSNILWNTQSLRYGLYKPSSDFIAFPAPISIVAAVSGGLYVVADRTYWLAGSSPEDFTITSVLQYTAAKGSLCKLPNSNEVVWYSSAGLVKAGPNGQVTMIQEPNVRGAPSDEGASVYIESGSVKRVISSVSGDPFATALSARDYMDAEIERARR